MPPVPGKVAGVGSGGWSVGWLALVGLGTAVGGTAVGGPTVGTGVGFSGVGGGVGF